MKDTANDRRLLRYLLELLRKSIQPRKQNSLQRVGDLQCPRKRCGHPSFSFQEKSSALDQRTKDFFKEKRIAFRFIKDFRRQRLRQVIAAEKVLHQGSAFFNRE